MNGSVTKHITRRFVRANFRPHFRTHEGQSARQVNLKELSLIYLHNMDKTAESGLLNRG